jgi:hypothetical protein
VSFSPENEQIDTPLLILVPGAEGWLVGGGGPLISPADASVDAARAATPKASAQMLERLIMTDPILAGGTGEHALSIDYHKVNAAFSLRKLVAAAP